MHTVQQVAFDLHAERLRQVAAAHQVQQARRGRPAAVPSRPLPRLAMPSWRALLDRLVTRAAPARVGQ